jgi:hypothetical protein
VDSNKVFVLFCLSQLNKELQLGNIPKAIEYAHIATVDASQFIDQNDLHYV